jgi:hypothetical protein
MRKYEKKQLLEPQKLGSPCCNLPVHTRDTMVQVLGFGMGTGKPTVQGQGVPRVWVWCPILATQTKPHTRTAVSRVPAGFQPHLPITYQIKFVYFFACKLLQQQPDRMQK